MKKSSIKRLSNKGKHRKTKRQRHVHEFLGSTKLAEEGDDRHNHRFAGVSGEAIPRGDSHVHVLTTNTDFLDHHHRLLRIVTGPAIPVGNGKHIHFVKGVTTFVDGHVHVFNLTTLIDNPIG
ncbi:YmaF family protein [Tumebacillus permanentifrigoris]|uniref:YmaF-like protein n=1 Tax=Tumebacillus permanentifrigoris TaxID=378543 RepID=A0A316DDI1_9BACL|nr:YmaF family protein [Tumebacillus permanentifrigoris]PWK14850.1 YmaF-like protein [Tumebacillus permanentifrigoris]